MITEPDDAHVPRLNLTSREVVHAIGSPRLFQRLRHHGWLQPLFPSRDPLFPLVRVLAVQQRLERGEIPPLLPCEIRQRVKAARAKSAKAQERICVA